MHVGVVNHYEDPLLPNNAISFPYLVGISQPTFLFFPTLNVSHRWRTNSSIPNWFPVLPQEELSSFPVTCAGQLLPSSEAAPRTWPSPVQHQGCGSEELPQLPLSGNSWPPLLAMPYFPNTQICALVARSVVIKLTDKTNHRSVTECQELLRIAVTDAEKGHVLLSQQCEQCGGSNMSLHLPCPVCVCFVIPSSSQLLHQPLEICVNELNAAISESSQRDGISPCSTEWKDVAVQWKSARQGRQAASVHIRKHQNIQKSTMMQPHTSLL